MLPLLIDEDSMGRALVRGLRSRGVDVLTVFEAGRLHLSDEEHLAFASSVGRVIYSCNVKDFARLHREWLTTGLHHAGIIVVPYQAMDVGLQIASLSVLMEALDEELMRDRLEFLSNWRA